MSRRVAAWALAACLAAPALAQTAPVPEITVAQIIEKNAAARGGVEAWKKIQTMAWAGHVEGSRPMARQANFLLEQKRPDKTRFEFALDQQKSLRVYDGKSGWKMKPGSSGRPELVPYTPEELKFAREAQVIDGPLMDLAAKGLAIALEGVDALEGRKAYRLAVRNASGMSHRVWIDAETFLDLRLDRLSRSEEGRVRAVSVMYRNYQAFEGLQIPTVVETGAQVNAGAPAQTVDRLVIERIALNPALEDRAFTKPALPWARRNAVTVDTRVPPPSAPPPAPRPAP